jgi:hypothetical protein
MEPATGINEWLARRRERREERRRKMKEHRDAIRNFLNVLSGATIYRKRIGWHADRGEDLMPQAPKDYEAFAIDLESAGEQLHLLFPNIGDDQVLIETAVEAQDALSKVVAAVATAHDPDAEEFVAALDGLHQAKTKFIQAARLYTAV